MATFEVDIDGATYEVDAPDENTAWAWANETHSQSKPSTTQTFLKGAADLGKGALSGAADIGNNLIKLSSNMPIPRMMASAATEFNGGKNPLDVETANREAGLESFNKQNDSIPFNVGRIGANIAGTMGAGGAIGTALQGASKTPQALALANAIKTGGFGGGNTLTNIAGGGANAAIGGLLVDPTTFKESAAIGAALPALGAAAPKIGSLIADAFGLTTGAGGESIRTAAKSGLRGGQVADDFANNMRGNVPITDVLDTAKQNLQEMIAQKGQAYRSGMQNISADKTVLDFKPIAKALNDQVKVGSFKGKVTNSSTADTQGKLKAIVEDWGSSAPNEFHTPEGMDALKRAVGDVRESTPYGTPSRKVADSIYHAIKGEISNQAPTYSKTMKEYSDASELIGEIESSLLSRKSPDTAIRKLQSLMRNNVNTNYGRRMELAQALQEQGGKEILPSLAGQSLSSIAPRGLQGALAGASSIAGVALNPSMLATLPLQSPRLVGEAALATGKASRGLKNIGKAMSPSYGAIAAALQRD